MSANHLHLNRAASRQSLSGSVPRTVCRDFVLLIVLLLPHRTVSLIHSKTLLSVSCSQSIQNHSQTFLFSCHPRQNHKTMQSFYFIYSFAHFLQNNSKICG